MEGYGSPAYLRACTFAGYILRGEAGNVALPSCCPRAVCEQEPGVSIGWASVCSLRMGSGRLRKAQATWSGNDGMGTCILLLLLFATPLKTISWEDFDVYLQDGRTVPSLALKSQSPSLSQQPPPASWREREYCMKNGSLVPQGGYSVLTPRHKHRCVLGDNDI